ncbi:MAG: PTS glucose transporter subunit IIA [Ruminococcaceae bacterium]|nr:PTS glucose transporter subunit IIA [Oscillospiraceae bacterium]
MKLFSKNKTISVVSPLTGVAVDLSEVNDPTFSERILGNGIAILPSVGRLYSPISGLIESISESAHAIAIVGDNGVEILIHIGIDTVELNGEPFSVRVKVGDRVDVGHLLIEFDLGKIISSGYDAVTPIIVTNSSDYSKLDFHKGKINAMESLIEIKK